MVWPAASFGQEQLRPATTTATTRPTTARVLDVLKIEGGYEVTFDTTEAPELREWVDKKLKPVTTEWYPKIVALLPSEGFEAPKRFTITFLKDMRGVANASGTQIRAGVPWFKGQLDREALGALVHEMVHVVQQYRGARGGNRNPGWLVEGLADYIRWQLYEPKEKRRRPDARWKYDGSYHQTGAFLEYVLNTHDKEIVKKLNAVMRQGKYTPEFFKEHTGKTIEELGAEWAKTLPPRQ
jgi:hypothetical protein